MLIMYNQKYLLIEVVIYVMWNLFGRMLLMKKVLLILLSMVCVFTLGCQKKGIVNLGDVSGELDKKISGENNFTSNPDILSGDETSSNNEENISKDDTYIFPDSSTKKIERYEIRSLSLDRLEKAKNEIFARHGHDFSSKSLKEYFEGKSWYKAVPGKKVSVSELNKTEQANVNLLDRRIKELVDDANGYERQEELISMNKFSKPIKILKEISISDVDKKYYFDWDTQKNEYPLAQKYLLNDTYENKKLGVSKLEVYFCGFRYDDYVDRIFEINVNGVKKEVISDGPIYVIDIDENDSYLEIATDDAWENGCYTSITRFINNKFVDMGSMNDAIGGLEDYRCFNGKIYDWYSLNFEEEIIIPKYFVIENDKIVMKIVKYEEVKDKVYTVTEDVLHTFKCEDKLKVGDKIKILNIYDNSDEITFECQGMVLRVMNEKGDIFEIGYAGSWAT